MTERKFKVGQVYKTFKVVGVNKEKPYIRYDLECLICGGHFTASTSNLDNHGCPVCRKIKYEEEKLRNLTAKYVGQKFGHLEVQSVELGCNLYGSRDWTAPFFICKCDLCGSVKKYPANRILNNGAKTCGCKEAEYLQLGTDIKEAGQINGTNVYYIQRKNQNKNSTTGIRGVSFMQKVGKYRAYITLDRKQHYLGLYDTIEEAKAAREEAEEKMFAPIIEEWRNQS